MATPKDAFIAYYKANPDKLKGKSIEQAYAAMRAEAGRKRLRSKSADAKIPDTAVARRLAKAGKLSRENAGRSGSERPDSYGGSLKHDIGVIGKTVSKGLPKPGFGSNQNGGSSSAAKQAGIPGLTKLFDKLPKTQRGERLEKQREMAEKMAEFEKQKKDRKSYHGGRRE